MNCDVWQDKTDAFVDSELTPGKSRVTRSIYETAGHARLRRCHVSG